MIFFKKDNYGHIAVYGDSTVFVGRLVDYGTGHLWVGSDWALSSEQLRQIAGKLDEMNARRSERIACDLEVAADCAMPRSSNS